MNVKMDIGSVMKAVNGIVDTIVLNILLLLLAMKAAVR